MKIVVLALLALAVLGAPGAIVLLNYLGDADFRRGVNLERMATACVGRYAIDIVTVSYGAPIRDVCECALIEIARSGYADQVMPIARLDRAGGLGVMIGSCRDRLKQVPA